jgi:hypothetical protein
MTRTNVEELRELAHHQYLHNFRGWLAKDEETFGVPISFSAASHQLHNALCLPVCGIDNFSYEQLHTWYVGMLRYDLYRHRGATHRLAILEITSSNK